ncbi:MAG: DegT/DnrJ/EryC1/StrS family aminotransferase [bacterium]|jgi:dTDP-4-amino-4,6-dideoxygalactose transaminase
MIRLARPEIKGALESIEEVLKDGYLVQGRRVGEFENMVAEYVGRTHAVAVSSGTSAIQCALEGLGIGIGDEVIVPDFTFPACANAVVACGARPVFADIDLETFNISTDSIQKKISPDTRAVMPVDLFGLPADLEAISGICAERGIAMAEDSACALGADIGGRKCGSFGAVSMLSFHPRKVITTGEGGMVLTDDDELADNLRMLRNHGMSVAHGRAEFSRPGYNMRMNELEASLGIPQMGALDVLVEKRRHIAGLYAGLLGELPGVRPPVEPGGSRHTYQSYVVLLDDDVDRDGVILAMRELGVETTIGTYSVHSQPFYMNAYGYEAGSISNSYRAFRQSLCLPIYPSLREDEVSEVARCLKESLQTAQ